MAFSNIRNKQKDSGFTIVELLVVIVVIGILAAITIVSYTGVTARAKTTKAQSNAASIVKVAEICYAENNIYPATTGAFATCTTTARPPAGVAIAIGLPGVGGIFTGTEPLSTSNGETTIGWACSGGTATTNNCAGATGGRITYFDFSTSARSATVLYVGQASAASTFFSPAS